jgi:16S rRNA (guanine966-N2)-methyltransferase
MKLNITLIVGARAFYNSKMAPSSTSRRASARPSDSERTPSKRAPAAPGHGAAARVATHAPREVRIIGGTWKRTPLPVPVAAGLRPTPNRVRETLFNWLGQDLGGWRVLDAFAGSGALGFEAASRGADSVMLLERDATLVRSLKAVQARLKADQVQIRQGDALSWMGQPAHAAEFDLVFLDPPFDDDAFAAALQVAAGVIKPGGWIYLESSRAMGAASTSGRVDGDADLPAGLILRRHGQAGSVHFHLFERQVESVAFPLDPA